jgi:hypothetical protein
MVFVPYFVILSRGIKTICHECGSGVGAGTRF